MSLYVIIFAILSCASSDREIITLTTDVKDVLNV